MIDRDEGPHLTDEDEAFIEQWLKVWFGATFALESAGWKPERGLHTDMWTPPPDVPATVWAAQCVNFDAEDAREIAARSSDPSFEMRRTP